ncbi:hypothetical protein [Streptomyces caniscabiei]|uniref:hypothetical protein n=1 Tax=Streptomyces caniscabiei TaxID=2746961 RepID=UPI0029AFAF05|nr:hypothetical protein [Streptomyces caniscabiei]MDX2986432.1 hypothetical protein [Streptomyces caniscabiei]
MSTDTITAERDSAFRQWLTFIKYSQLRAELGPWTRLDTDAGPLLSAQVDGPDAAEAVREFVLGDRAVGTVGGYRRPGLDYTVPGRVACVWQSNGVWVEFWHADQPAPRPTPLTVKPLQVAALPQGAARRSLIGRASGRLPFPRRKKETTSR